MQTCRSENLRELSVDELVFHMPTVARMAGTDWAKGFALSVVAQSRRRNWKPTPKQLGMMRRMVSELFTALRDDDDDLFLIE